ncbi:hypothetical protein ABKP09_19635 [Peribacillus frigoritolerans]|uniref:hypothetical protein n=1 Tax=Peribacillus frigoritolerans TaxID=450367 RepID=UPI0032B5B70A
MKKLSKLSLIFICAYFLTPASEDWMTWKPSVHIFDENGKLVDKLEDTPKHPPINLAEFWWSN